MEGRLQVQATTAHEGMRLWWHEGEIPVAVMERSPGQKGWPFRVGSHHRQAAMIHMQPVDAQRTGSGALDHEAGERRDVLGHTSHVTCEVSGDGLGVLTFGDAGVDRRVGAVVGDPVLV